MICNWVQTLKKKAVVQRGVVRDQDEVGNEYVAKIQII